MDPEVPARADRQQAALHPQANRGQVLNRSRALNRKARPVLDQVGQADRVLEARE